MVPGAQYDEKRMLITQDQELLLRTAEPADLRGQQDSSRLPKREINLSKSAKGRMLFSVAPYGGMRRKRKRESARLLTSPSRWPSLLQK